MGDEQDVVTSAAEQMPFIVILCEGPDLRLAWINDATRALIPDRDAVGRTLAEVFADLSGQQWIDMYSTVYRTGEAIAGAEWRAHLTNPDGSIHEIYSNFSISPWRDARGEIRGVIGAGFDVTEIVTARITAERETAQLQERYEQTRDVVTALQRELLPRGLPVLPGLQVAATYLLADTHRSAGGDWFDAVVRPDGTVALVVGDVVGHGVTASGAMGQLRAVLQDRLDSGADLVEALTAADRFARRLPAARATTVCVAVLDPADGSLEYCTAGHPPPLVVSDTGGTRYLRSTGGGPLGTGDVGEFPVRSDRLEVGDLLLLYSDGILERPGRDPAASIEDLARVAASAATGRALHAPDATAADRVCTQTVELLVRATGHDDDITLLAAQRVTPSADLDLVLPAELTSLRASRIALADWLAGVGATDDDIFVLQHALGELTTNAIEHAFGGELGHAAVEVCVTLTPEGQISARVTDHGTWREPARQTLRGRGLALTAQLVTRLTVVPGEHGTVATVLHTLTRPARTPELTDGRPPHIALGEPLRLEDVPGSGDAAVRVEGPVDATTAAHLQQDLLQRTRGGHLPLSVDLTGVTHLASAGVAALHYVADRHRREGTELDLHARRGSVAQHVLELVALPHRVDQAAGHTVPGAGSAAEIK
ncbi:SpoIIE family protein phosphatase [Actinoplanes friuliensis]|uniref:Regulator of sigma subunit, anti-anti-sigma factor RsbU n=1 Tax=Actinoplanes friuliensis DSM 7358 TaxID=1246995 RepID=U5VZB1_9ACTN|nr:SpoIIE family protein phosphatase [Actinoplanes friuliensis]AGZ42214.1 regulator of sigma subunit, anti-anti-sigma factor RsbU [Actinoplanes friuliensis DSM 7358]